MNSKFIDAQKPARTLIAAAIACAVFLFPAEDAFASVRAELPTGVTVLDSGSAIKGALKETKSTGRLRLFLKEGSMLTLPRAASKVFIATPGIASFHMPSPNKVFFFGQSAGNTTFYALDASGKVIAALEVTVEHNLEKLKADIRRAVPSAKIELVPALNNRMVVRGKVKTALDARRVTQLVAGYLASVSAQGAAGGGDQSSGSSSGSGDSADTSSVINQLKVEVSQQVNIQVRVVEVSRSLTHSLGFNWGSVLNTARGPLYMGIGNSRSLFGTPAGYTRFTQAGSYAAGTANIPSLMPNSGDSSAIGGIFNFGKLSLGLLIDAMSEQGFASLLAEPNLTAMSGQPAAFASGGEVPILIVTGNSITIDYKSWGVILRMTPTVLSPNRIAIHVAPEVSELTSEGQVVLGESVIPAVRVRRAETTVELASGQSFALAGMLRSESSQVVDGVPGLRRIPFVGRLFESEKTEVEDSELVILMTANIVDPANASDFKSPGEGLKAVDDYLPKHASVGYLF